jgi:hypothetical protein
MEIIIKDKITVKNDVMRSCQLFGEVNFQISFNGRLIKIKQHTEKNAKTNLIYLIDFVLLIS